MVHWHVGDVNHWSAAAMDCGMSIICYIVRGIIQGTKIILHKKYTGFHFKISLGEAVLHPCLAANERET